MRDPIPNPSAQAQQNEAYRAAVEHQYPCRLTLHLIQDEIARDRARDDHEALENGDHVQRLEAPQPNRQHVQRDAGERERHRREQVGVHCEEGIERAGGGGARVVVVVRHHALGHLDHRLRGEHVAGECAAQSAAEEAGHKG